MKDIYESGPSGNRPADSKLALEPQEGGELHDGPPSPAPQRDTGYPVLQPDEADPNLGDLPPDFKNGNQAALNAQARGFDLVRLRSDGTRAPLTTKLEHALAAARRGFRVFPITPGAKAPPLLKDWPVYASADPGQITSWWTKWPDANIGVVTDNLAVADLDARKFVNGRAAELEAWCLKYLPEEHRTLAVKTWSDGRHFLYRLPKDMRLSSRNDAFLHGIDLKTGSNAYLVGAGSVIDGKEYAWANDRPIIELPEPLIECLRQRKALKTTADKSSAAGERVVEEDDWAVQQGKACIERAEPILDGARNSMAIRICNQLYDYGVSEATAKDLMLRWNAEKCSPPLELSVIETTVRSAARTRIYPIGIRHSKNANGFEPVDIGECKVLSTLHKENSPRLKSFERRPISEMPRREWLIDDMLCRGCLSILAGPPGVSKTTLLLMVALALVTGRDDILGMPVVKRSRVAFWNQEDEYVELERRIVALCLAFDIKNEELLDENGKTILWLNSGVDAPFFLARAKDRGIQRSSQIDDMIADIKAEKIDALILDPLVEFHETEESDNGKMRSVMSFAREISKAAGCACYIGTHARKPDKASSKNYAGDMDVIRGASSQVGAARIAHTLFLASEEDAKKFNMEGSHHNYVRLDMAKNNLGRRWAGPHWFKFGEEMVGGDPIGIIKPAPLGPVLDNRADILAEAMHKAGLDKAKAKDVIAGLPDHQKKLFGKNPAHWARKAQEAFFDPSEGWGHTSKWGVLSWSCAGARCAMWLHLKPAPTAH
jgi:Bifunctional DNA primase/polymerase, N-terminal/AAA domain/Primase C terminal 1 (PriCT-1)